jgi:hypothetical protein
MKQKSGPEKAPAEQVVKDIRRQTRRQYSAQGSYLVVDVAVLNSFSWPNDCTG